MKFVILGSHAFSFLTEEKNQLRQILNLDGGPNFNAIDFKQLFSQATTLFSRNRWFQTKFEGCVQDWRSAFECFRVVQAENLRKRPVWM